MKDENRLHTCSGNEDAMMDKRQDQKGPCQKPCDTRGCQMSTFLRQEILWYGHIRKREEDNLALKTNY